MSNSVLGSVTMGYQPVWNAWRQRCATRLVVEPNLSSAVDAQHLLHTLHELWPAGLDAQILVVRTPALPDLPTADEMGITAFDMGSWYGFAVAARTPRPIIERYHREMMKVLQMPDIRARLHDMEFDVIASTPEAITRAQALATTIGHAVVSTP